jgi:tetratricopeptide (TPR) repeat protein
MARGRDEEALADLHRGLALAADDRDLLLDTAEVYRRLDRPQRALATLAILGETYPPNQTPAHVLALEGMAQESLGRRHDACESYRQAIARGDGADAVLNTTLTSVNRAPARSVRGNVLATSEFLLFTTVSFELLEQAGGRTVMSGQVTGQTSFFVTGDLQTDESQALPLAFSDAAVKLTSRLSEGF